MFGCVTMVTKQFSVENEQNTFFTISQSLFTLETKKWYGWKGMLVHVSDFEIICK